MDRDQFPPSEIRHLESMIASMRVNELQTVLSMFKMPKLGKKQELIQRCTDLLRSPSLQIQVANQVKLMIGKGSRVAPYPVPVRTNSNAEAHELSTLLCGEKAKVDLKRGILRASRSYVPNGTMMNGSAAGYAGYRSGQLLHQMQTNALHQQCRPMRNLVPMDLPFYDNPQILLEPMELPAVISGVKSPCKQSFSFTVPRERFNNWTPSAPLPRFEIQLRFFQVPTGYSSQELADDFPLNAGARIEDQNVQLPAVIPTNKPNVEPKRPSRPVDITQLCLNVRDPSRPLRLMVEWTGDKRTWAVAVYLVYRVTSEILRDRATGVYTGPVYGNKEPVDHHQGEHVTRDMIRARLSGGNDDEIAMSQLKISLLCPLSRTRIKLPARCKKCPHLQCFDLYNYLQMNEKRPTWRCPVCSDWAPYKLLIIDAYFQNILTNVDAGAVEVELLVDGSYRTVKSECIDVDSDDMSSTDIKPSVSGLANGFTVGNTATTSKSKSSCDDDIIVLSDSDDEDDQAVERAIRASIADSSNSTNSAQQPLSPTPRSRDSSIIILDDESPPRPPPTSIPNKTCSNSGSSLASMPTAPTTTAAFTLPPSTSTIACNGDGVMASRVPTIQQHNVLAGHQNIYNNSGALSYYHQSQWSQPAASRPQYPPPPAGTLNAGAAFSMSYKQSLGNLLGRYQATNNPSGLSFNYAAATAPPPQQQTFAPGSNLQQVLASLVQQSQYTNGTGGNVPMSQ